MAEPVEKFMDDAVMAVWGARWPRRTMSSRTCVDYEDPCAYLPDLVGWRDNVVPVPGNHLTPTSYVVLGMTALRGPTTSYDLKRAIGRSIGYFWRFPHTQIYDEPARLASQGLLRVTREAHGRQRNTYTITDVGLRHLRTWLQSPTADHFQLRSEAELKLFFGELARPEDVLLLAKGQVRLHEERLKEYQAISRRYSRIPALEERLVPLGLGLTLERAALRFWRGQVVKNAGR